MDDLCSVANVLIANGVHEHKAMSIAQELRPYLHTSKAQQDGGLLKRIAELEKANQGLSDNVNYFLEQNRNLKALLTQPAAEHAPLVPRQPDECGNAFEEFYKEHIGEVPDWFNRRTPWEFRLWEGGWSARPMRESGADAQFFARELAETADLCAFYRYQAMYYCAHATHGRAPSDKEINASIAVLEANRVAENKERLHPTEIEGGK